MNWCACGGNQSESLLRIRAGVACGDGGLTEAVAAAAAVMVIKAVLVKTWWTSPLTKCELAWHRFWKPSRTTLKKRKG